MGTRLGEWSWLPPPPPPGLICTYTARLSLIYSLPAWAVTSPVDHVCVVSHDTSWVGVTPLQVQRYCSTPIRFLTRVCDYFPLDSLSYIHFWARAPLHVVTSGRWANVPDYSTFAFSHVDIVCGRGTVVQWPGFLRGLSTNYHYLQCCNFWFFLLLVSGQDLLGQLSVYYIDVLCSPLLCMRRRHASRSATTTSVHVYTSLLLTKRSFLPRRMKVRGPHGWKGNFKAKVLGSVLDYW